MSANQVVFLVLAALALFGAVGVVAFGNNPVRSAISLVLNFVILAIIYFTLGNQYLGITQVMVYAGAIMVLFLFVIMILKLRQVNPEMKQAQGSPLMGILFGLAFAVILGSAVVAPAMTLSETGLTRDALEAMGKPQAIGILLYSQYVPPFIVSSILLTIGVVGSILLAKRKLR